MQWKCLSLRHSQLPYPMRSQYSCRTRFPQPATLVASNDSSQPSPAGLLTAVDVPNPLTESCTWLDSVAQYVSTTGMPRTCVKFLRVEVSMVISLPYLAPIWQITSLLQKQKNLAASELSPSWWSSHYLEWNPQNADALFGKQLSGLLCKFACATYLSLSLQCDLTWNSPLVPSSWHQDLKGPTLPSHLDVRSCPILMLLRREGAH